MIPILQSRLSSRSKLRWSLFGCALAVRLIYVALGYEVPPQDTSDYDEIALNLLQEGEFVARGNWHGFEMRSWRAPFYPFFLATVYWTVGHSHFLVRLVQCIVGAWTVVLLYELGRRLHPKSSLLVGLIALIYGPLVVISNEVMTETWFIFWSVLCIHLLANSPNGSRKNIQRNLGAGAALGLAILTRPVGLFILPALVVTEFARRRKGSVPRVAMVCLAAILVVLPWTVRNYALHGVWPILSTHGGFILARSNSANPDWRQPKGWGIPLSDFQNMPSEIERDRYWYQRGIEYISDNPIRYARWVGERFLRFWYFFHPEYNFWFMTLIPFTILGYVRFWKEGDYLLVGSFVGISIVLFASVLYGSSRFRLPLEPFFILFGAAFIHHLSEQWGQVRIWTLTGAIMATNLTIYWNGEIARELMLNVLRMYHLK